MEQCQKNIPPNPNSEDTYQVDSPSWKEPLLLPIINRFLDKKSLFGVFDNQERSFEDVIIAVTNYIMRFDNIDIDDKKQLQDYIDWIIAGGNWTINIGCQIQQLRPDYSMARLFYNNSLLALFPVKINSFAEAVCTIGYPR